MGRASRRRRKSRLQAESAKGRVAQTLPWYESNLFWGSLSLTVSITLAVLAVMQDVRWLLWLAWGCSWLTVWAIFKNIESRLKRCIWVFVAILVVGCGLYKLNDILAPKTEVSKEIPKKLSAAVLMDCQLIGLPISIPPHSTIDIIPLNKKRMERQNWGFYQIPNTTDKTVIWPDKRKLDLSEKSRNAGVFTYKCDITNSGSEKILYLAVPIDLWFGNDKKTIKYRPIVSSLGIDQTFSFYVVNDCPVNVSAAWQDIPTKVTFLGESTPRNIVLKRKYRNPAEQIMMFLESSVRWVGEQQCD